MKKKPAKKSINKLISTLMLAVLLTAGTGCGSRSEKLYEQASTEVENGNYSLAAELLEKTSQLESENIQKYKYLGEAARIYRFELQNYAKALSLLREIILSSEDEGQRIAAQESITEIYFENLQDYQMALKELQILEPLLKDNSKKEKVRLRIAQMLYLTGNSKQALEEITSAEKYVKFQALHFLKLKAEILLAERRYKETLQTYEELRAKNPAYFADENLYIATSIVYEENEQYAEGLNYLIKNEASIKDKAYYELRVKRLKAKIANKPLSKGIRK
jgi:tetratricopeptide (TPR) repeat protein